MEPNKWSSTQHIEIGRQNILTPNKMSINSESTPPPLIGKIGPYTVFMTPPSTPKPSDDHPVTTKIAPPPPQIPKAVPSPKPVSDPDDSVFGFFRNAVTKVQTGAYLTLLNSQIMFFVFLILVKGNERIQVIVPLCVTVM